MVDTPKYISFLESSYALLLPGLKSPHLRLQCLHLHVQLRKPLLDVTETVDLGTKGFVPYACERVVNARRIHIVEAEGYEVIGAEAGHVSDVVTILPRVPQKSPQNDDATKAADLKRRARDIARDSHGIDDEIRAMVSSYMAPKDDEDQELAIG